MSADAFRFDIDRVKSPFSKTEIIASLKKYAQTHMVDSFGMRDYDACNGKILSAERISIRFGTGAKLYRLPAVVQVVAIN